MFNSVRATLCARRTRCIVWVRARGLISSDQGPSPPPPRSVAVEAPTEPGASCEYILRVYTILPTLHVAPKPLHRLVNSVQGKENWSSFSVSLY